MTPFTSASKLQQFFAIEGRSYYLIHSSIPCIYVIVYSAVHLNSYNSARAMISLRKITGQREIFLKEVKGQTRIQV